MDTVDDIHDQLVKAYLKYYAAYEWWSRKKSVRASREAKFWLKEIRRLAKEQWLEVDYHRYHEIPPRHILNGGPESVDKWFEKHIVNKKRNKKG